IHENWFHNFDRQLLDKLAQHQVTIHGDEQVKAAYSDAVLATEEDWATEYLSLDLSVKLVNNMEEAIEHINTYGTNHSEASITENEKNANTFLQNVDAAAVYHNASTRF